MSDPTEASSALAPPVAEEAAPPQTSAAVWRELLALDVARLGELSKDPRIDRALRAELRPLLWQVWQTLSPPEDPEESPPEESGEVPVEAATAAEGAGEPSAGPNADELRRLAGLCAEALRRCGDDRGAGAWPIGRLRIGRPFVDRVSVPPSARQTDQLALRVTRHFKARLALTEARIKWFEDRANSQAPTSVAQVRQPAAEKERLGLELLRKRGTSRYS